MKQGIKLKQCLIATPQDCSILLLFNGESSKWVATEKPTGRHDSQGVKS
jgi:hypothetical protein